MVVLSSSKSGPFCCEVRSRYDFHWDATVGRIPRQVRRQRLPCALLEILYHVTTDTALNYRAYRLLMDEQLVT